MRCPLAEKAHAHRGRKPVRRGWDREKREPMSRSTSAAYFHYIGPARPARAPPAKIQSRTPDRGLLDLRSRRGYRNSMAYKHLITIEPDKRSGQPCIRGLQMTVQDVLDYLASGISVEEILADFPDLTAEDIRACLAFASCQADPECAYLEWPRGGA